MPSLCAVVKASLLDSTLYVVEWFFSNFTVYINHLQIPGEMVFCFSSSELVDAVGSQPAL